MGNDAKSLWPLWVCSLILGIFFQMIVGACSLEKLPTEQSESNESHEQK
jgi:hypothetical protein